jgi:hypothetical protein
VFIRHVEAGRLVGLIYTPKAMALWTFIADYRGGTYISQCQAPNCLAALTKWAKAFPEVRGSFIGSKTRAKLIVACRDKSERPIAIASVRNVWYWSPLGMKMVVHIIRTDGK